MALVGCASALFPAHSTLSAALSASKVRLADAVVNCHKSPLSKGTECRLAAKRPWFDEPEAGRAEATALGTPPSIPSIPGVRGLSAQAAFAKLCDSAGDFYLKSGLQDVDGFAYVRPRMQVGDEDLTSIDALEDPRGYRGSTVRFLPYVAPLEHGWAGEPGPVYRFVETFDVGPVSLAAQRALHRSFREAPAAGQTVARYTVTSEDARELPYRREFLRAPAARYGITWRGTESKELREMGVAGGESVIFDRETREVVAVRRNFYLATPALLRSGLGIHWFAAASCPSVQLDPGVWPDRSFVTRAIPPRE
jgi:hypothetical protein